MAYLRQARKRLLVFASGTATGGGSGFAKLVQASRMGILDALVVGVVSNHKDGGVCRHAKELAVVFQHFPKPWAEEKYREIVVEFRPDFVALSGWLKLVRGLDPRTTFNIHPGPLPEYGGKGMYGHRVHEKVWQDCQAGKIHQTAISMHFVDAEYDKGPVFFHYPIDISPEDSVDCIARKANSAEHFWQPRITNLVIRGDIAWDGENPESLVLPRKYNFPRRK
jgi:folate-dependent phosphoribosylglycinamide formyltransferase PurN